MNQKQRNELIDEATAWIAENDEPEEDRPEAMMFSPAVLLLAALAEADPILLARAVCAKRRACGLVST